MDEVTESYECQVLKSANSNHIWINAINCINPTPEFLQSIGSSVVRMLNCKENLVIPFQDIENESIRAIGRLSPELIVRINKS